MKPAPVHFAVTLAFLPAAFVGALAAYDFIKSVLFNPVIVSVSLILGGTILWIERGPAPTVNSIETMPMKTALAIGLVNAMSMIPGVSRAGATIMGALLLKVERKISRVFLFPCHSHHGRRDSL